MKGYIFLYLLFFCFLSFTACTSPSNVNQQPANTQNVNADLTPSPSANVSPLAEKSPSEEEKKFEEADFPEITQTIHQKVNEFRQSQGLPPLEYSPVISEEAREHSEEMAENPNTISHRKFDDRISDIREKLSFSGAAENVAANLNYESPGEKAVEGWIKSPTHRKNMLGDYTMSGIGVYKTGNDRYFFTQIYWKP